MNPNCLKSRMNPPRRHRRRWTQQPRGVSGRKKSERERACGDHNNQFHLNRRRMSYLARHSMLHVPDFEMRRGRAARRSYCSAQFPVSIWGEFRRKPSFLAYILATQDPTSALNFEIFQGIMGLLGIWTANSTQAQLRGRRQSLVTCATAIFPLGITI